MTRVVLMIAVVVVSASLGRAVQAETPAPLQTHEAPKALPELAFRDRNGGSVSLADFRGKTVLLNIWATWCVPCREEMPALDRLQTGLGGDAFQVVALSIDRGGAEVVQRFYAEIGIRNLEIFTDSAGKVARDLAIPGLPVTLLIDADGRETASAIGPVAWDDPEMVEFIRAQLDAKPVRAIVFSVSDRSPRRTAHSIALQLIKGDLDVQSRWHSNRAADGDKYHQPIETLVRSTFRDPADRIGGDPGRCLL